MSKRGDRWPLLIDDSKKLVALFSIHMFLYFQIRLGHVDYVVQCNYGRDVAANDHML